MMMTQEFVAAEAAYRTGRMAAAYRQSRPRRTLRSLVRAPKLTRRQSHAPRGVIHGI